jgi:heme oxygenase
MEEAGKRIKRVELSFSVAEHEIIRQKAFKANLQLAVYLRECGLNKELKESMPAEERKKIQHLQRDLAGMGNNLNQAIKKMHQEGFGKHAAEIVGIINKIDKIISHGN